MGRILALDVGRKRTGIAVTDPLRIAANGVDTLPTAQVPDWVKGYAQREELDAIVVGYPRTMADTPSEANKYIEPLVNRLRKLVPHIPLERHDERFTSVLAQQTILAGGVPKMKRQDKGLVDMVSATIILQSYLEALEWKENHE